MIATDFEAALLRALAHARSFYAGLPERPVTPRVSAEAILAELDRPMPAEGRAPAAGERSAH